MKNILVTTKHRGVWFAQVPNDIDLTLTTLTGLKNTRMAIIWGTTDGPQQLCAIGPTEKSKLSAISDIEVLHDITAVFNVTDEAANKWLQ